MELYTTIQAINEACANFHTQGQSLQGEAHKIACSVLHHVGEHGDVRVVAKFLQTMPEMSRVNALKAWFEEFGPVAFDTKGALFVKDKATKIGEAMAMPFWKFKVEAPYVPVDAAKALDKLIKRLVKDTKETGTDHSVTIQALRLVPIHVPTVVTEPTVTIQ
jgi:hypothetical protein